VHVVPRRKKDGLRGFFWPRQPYKTPEDAEEVRKMIAGTVDRLRAGA
jgi:histidine triad (HIT) family protein